MNSSASLQTSSADATVKRFNYPSPIKNQAQDLQPNRPAAQAARREKCFNSPPSRSLQTTSPRPATDSGAGGGAPQSVWLLKDW